MSKKLAIMPDLNPSQVITNAEAYAASTDDPMFKDLIPDAATQAFFSNATSTAGSTLNLLQTLGAAALRSNARVPDRNLLQTYPAPAISYDQQSNQFNYGATLRFESAKENGPIYSLSDEIPVDSDFIYVSNSGSDANNGLSADTPIKTFTKASEVHQQGHTILLKAGDTFRGDDGALILKPNTRVGVYDYTRGVDAMPEVNPLIDFANSGFSAEGTVNVWQGTAPQFATIPDLPASLDEPPTPWVFEDGQPLEYVSNVSACSSTPGSWTFQGSASDWKTSSTTFYIHPADSSNPTTNGKRYEVSNIVQCIASVEDNVQVSDIFFNLAPTNNGSLVLSGDNCRSTNCLFANATKHSGFLAANGVFDGAVCLGKVPGSYWGGGTTLLVIYQFNPDAGDKTTYRNCVVTTSHDQPLGLYSHTSGDNFSESIIEDCYAYRLWQCFSSSNRDQFKLSNVYLENYRQGIKADDNCTIDGLTSIAHTVGGSCIQGLTSGSGSPIQVSDLAISGTSGFGSDQAFVGENDINISFMTSISNNKKLSVQRDTNGQRGVDNITNSIMVSQGSMIDTVTANPGVLDNNVYYDSAGTADFVFSGTTYNGLAALNAAFPALNTNSEEADPLLNDASALTSPNDVTDFSYGSGSPATAINAGARKWVTRPDWTALETQWAQKKHVLPRDTIGGSQVVSR